jgi:hypothetical protein
MTILRRILGRFRRKPCGDLAMFPYETATEFGYIDWACHLPRGHAGDHRGANPLLDRDAWPDDVEYQPREGS